jgi:flagellar protein FlaG
MEVTAISSINTGQTAPYEPAAPRPVTEDQRTLIQAVKAINAAELFGQDNELTFFLDRGTRRAVVRIINRETHEVIDQIPSEYILRMAEELKRA